MVVEGLELQAVRGGQLCVVKTAQHTQRRRNDS